VRGAEGTGNNQLHVSGIFQPTPKEDDRGRKNLLLPEESLQSHKNRAVKRKSSHNNPHSLLAGRDFFLSRKKL
jgi:hypothetical protein